MRTAVWRTTRRSTIRTNISREGRPSDTKSYDVRYQASAWNRVRGKRYFLTQRYNLGFTRELEEADEEGNVQEVFVPVSSIIHTIDYEDNLPSFHFP